MKDPDTIKATELLTQQHREVEKLFAAIEATEELAEKQALFRELAGNLVAHDAIEREIFYPACEEALGMNDLLGEALVEHGVIEFSLYQADDALDNSDFAFKCKVLKEMVSHHVKEEEEELFPKVEKALGPDSLELLGDEMLEAFEDARATDYHAPLFDNLRQVLAGTIKPVKRAAGEARKRGSARKSA